MRRRAWRSPGRRATPTRHSRTAPGASGPRLSRDGEAEPECGHATQASGNDASRTTNATTHDCDWGLTLGARCYLFRIGRARSVRPFPPDTAPRKGPEVKPQSQSSRSGDEMTRLVRTCATTHAR